MGLVDRLVPGVTTVTLNARYYPLHGLIADEAHNQDLDLPAAQNLMRRAEVAIGAVSARHLHIDPVPHRALSRPHAYDMIAPRVDAGGVDVGALAAPGVYAQPSWGFWSAYRGSETVLQITGTSEFAPGEQFDRHAVREGLGDVLALAAQGTLSPDVLDDHAHLCICQSAGSADGAWLARLLAQPEISDERQTRAWTRRQTLRILARCVQLSSVRQVSDDVSRFLAYDDAVTEDSVLAGTVVAAQWRGLILRNHSVGAWRDLWAWIVNGIDGLTARAALGDRFADALPEQTVGSFCEQLPATRTSGGLPAPAEFDAGLTECDWPIWGLSVLLLGARRARELSGPELTGFQGREAEDIFEELAPAWLAAQVDAWHDRPLHDFARWLADIMVNRSQRLALRKARPDARTGVLKIPSRVYLRDGFIFRDSAESGGRASLRLGQLAGVLAGTGLRAARNAGTRYVHGLAVPDSGAAFHPKVTVVAGRERAVVAIGSGNLSPGGWHLNKETWTVATADRERCPVIVTEVAEWLRTLDEVCAITPQALDGINRTATHLEQLAAAATAVDTGHRLVHTGTASLLEQLPDDDVDRLLLYAPFHDERAEALRQLIERLLPNSVTLAVQFDKRSVIQPDAVRRVVAGRGIQFDVIEDAEERYRHGKLVEAIGPDGSRWTLTGSPNLSARALLLSAAHGGNIEVGVVSRPDVSLFPEGRPIALSEVAAVRIDGPATSRAVASATLLAAVRTEDGIEVVFSKPLAEIARLMASVHADFDQWAEVGLAPVGATAHVLTGVDLPGGTRIRCAWGAGTQAVVGGIVFVIDRDQVLRRPGETALRGGVDSAGPAALITDPRLLELWLSALGEIASSPADTALPRIVAPAAPGGENAGNRSGGGLRLDTDDEDWLTATDDAKASLGAAMFHFAMGGLPSLRAFAGVSDGGLREPTDKLVDESRPGLDADDEAAVGDDTDPDGIAGLASDEFAGSSVDYFRDLAERERRRVRRRLESSVATEMQGHPAFSRLAILTLVLCAVQAELWDGPLGDQGWIRVVSDAFQKLDQGDIPDRLSGIMASWAAVATYLLHEHRPTTGRTAEVLLYEKAAASVSHLFPDADAQLVADLAAPFTNKNGYPVDPDAVMHVISMVVQADPLSEAIDILEANHPAWRVHRHNGVLLHVSGAFRATFLPAAEALDAVPGTGIAAVLATGTTAGWTIVIRDEGSLIRVEKNHTGQVTWWHYTLGNLIRPTGIARDHELANRVRRKYRRLDQPFPGALESLAKVQVDPVGDPPSRCPVSTI